jgi:hypothetical protein
LEYCFENETSNPEEINSSIESNLAHRDKGQPKLPSAGSVFKNLFLNDILQVNPSLLEFINEQGLGKGGKIAPLFYRPPRTQRQNHRRRQNFFRACQFYS